MTYESPSSPIEMLAFLSISGFSLEILESFVGWMTRRNAGCESELGLGFLEYLDFLPGIEGLDGSEGVPMDLNVSLVVVVSESETVAILVAESKRRSRRISSSISCWARRRWLNFSALALFHRANRTSVGGRFWSGLWVGFGFSGGAKIGQEVGKFSAICCLSRSWVPQIEGPRRQSLEL